MLDGLVNIGVGYFNNIGYKYGQVCKTAEKFEQKINFQVCYIF